jgi:hypothetical protein
MAFGPTGSFVASSSSPGSNGVSSAPAPAPNVVSNPVALLSSEQVLKSMSSVTDVPVSDTIMKEYNSRSPVLGSSNDLSLVNSPMLIGMTNLASQFCSSLISTETAEAAASRKFTASIDYTKGLSSVTVAEYTQVLNNFAMSFWGRAPSADESAILMQGETDFLSGLSGSDLTKTSGTSNLILFTCTGMLSSFEAYSF